MIHDNGEVEGDEKAKKLLRNPNLRTWKAKRCTKKERESRGMKRERERENGRGNG